MASGLTRLGIQKGDVVAVVSPNSPDFAVMFYGLLQLGAVITTINPDYTSCMYHLNYSLELLKLPVTADGLIFFKSWAYLFINYLTVLSIISSLTLKINMTL